MKEGETAVIGVSSGTSARYNSGLPGLANVPLLGWAFRSENLDSQRSELVYC
jgi:type II secretory pathway component GspD/PulD (secretin)